MDSAELSMALNAITARIEALMTGAAETSLILGPLSLLSHVYGQDRKSHLPDAPASEVNIHPQQADVTVAKRVFSFSPCA